MKKCFLITSYCNTEEKINILNQTIDSLEKYDMDICIHAHYPLDSEIQKRIQYYIFDESNPIIPINLRSLILWRRCDKYTLNILKRDYSYTSINQWKQGLLFLNDIGYDVAYVLNYDTVITDDIVRDIDSYSAILYLNKEKELNLLYSIIKISDFVDNIRTISQEDYIKTDEFWYAEPYLYDKLKSDNVLYLNDKIDDVYRINSNGFEDYEFEKYKFHFGGRINWVNGEKIYTDKFSVFFYDVEEKIDLKIIKDDKTYLYKEIINNNIIIDTDIITKDIEQSFGYYSDDEFIKGDNSIKIFINDVLLDDNVTSNFCLSAIEYNKPE